MPDTATDLRSAFREHLQLGSLRDAYDRLLSETCLQLEFDDRDAKMKVVYLRRDDCTPYKVEIYKWALFLNLCEPALESWTGLGQAPFGHSWPRYVKPKTNDENEDYEDEDENVDDAEPKAQPGFRIISVFDVRDIIDFSRHTAYALAD